MGEPAPLRSAVLGALVVVGALAATAARLRPPPPQRGPVAAGEFSSERGFQELEGLLRAAGDGVPHPVATPASRRVRERVVSRLRQVGLRPEVQESLACGRYRLCAPVANVAVRVPGRGPGLAVLVASHYDSVPAGPGAADDGSGVAIALELARALVASPAERDVVVLVDEGEEIGLAGAESFLGTPLAREVGAVVNLEARGTEGPSLLFETSGSSAFVAERFARSARAPLASSLFAAAYRLLPNDTDLTVLRALGTPGANLAFIGGASRYHTPLDDAAHLDRASLEHQGRNALALVRALAASDLEHAPQGEAVFFDLLGLAVVRFPSHWALPLALLALALALAGCAVAVGRGRATSGAVALGSAALPLAALGAAVLGLLAAGAPGLSAIRRPWVAHPGPLLGALFLSGACGASLPPLLLGERAGPWGLRLGVALGLSAGAVAVAAALPGASYLLLVPALVAGALALAGALFPPSLGPADAAVSLSGSLVLLPAAWLLYPAMGLAAGPLVASAAALAALPLAPVLGRLSRRARLALLLGPALLAALAAISERVLPLADLSNPEHLILYFHEDADSGRARVLAYSDLGRLPEPLRRAAAFSPSARAPFGWAAQRPSFQADLPDPGLPAPALEDLSVASEGGRLRVSARLRSRRGASEVQVALPPGVEVEAFSFDGVQVPWPEGRVVRWFGNWSVFRRLGLAREGTEVRMLLASKGPVDLEIGDQSSGLPREAAAVAAARPPGAVTAQEGDVTLVTRTVRLPAR